MKRKISKKERNKIHKYVNKYELVNLVAINIALDVQKKQMSWKKKFNF